MNGRMGEVVKTRSFKPDNVVVTCSSSGKLTSSLVTYWRDNCLLPSIPGKCLLLSDSWSAQSDPKLYEKSMCGGKDIVGLEILSKTTSDLQPLDTFFNRQIKNFIKKVHQLVALDEIDVHMSDRNNIIKLVSLLHKQLSAPVFGPMIRYAWYAASLLKDDPSPFQSVLEVCFPSATTNEGCNVHNFEESVFITCAICFKKLCFTDFFAYYYYQT